MQNTVLLGANLQGTHGQAFTLLKDDQLAQARMLLGATMPDGSRYDGHLRLIGDIQKARFDGIDTDEPEAMARWYEAPLSPVESLNRLIQLWQQQHPDETWTPERLLELPGLIDENDGERNQLTDGQDTEAATSIIQVEGLPIYIMSVLAMTVLAVILILLRKRRC